MKKYRMPFEYWDDEHTVLLRKERGPSSNHPEKDARWADDPEWYCRQHFRFDKDGGGPYFLNRRTHALLQKHGPFDGRYKDCEELVDIGYDSAGVFIFCPGPSLEEVNVSMFRNTLNLAVNSAAFYLKDRAIPGMWVLAESGYALWLVKQSPEAWSALHEAVVLATARVATVLRAHEHSIREFGGKLMQRCFVLRWEEAFVVPARTPAVTITNALVSAWQMGFKRAYVLGMDLSKPGGAYAKGVPHTKEGARNPFDDQVKALRQFKLPDFEVFNGSPYSQKLLPNMTAISYKDIQKVALEK